MTRALIYKEWKKTKWFAIGVSIVGAALLTYIFLRFGRSTRMVGLEHLWDVVINRDQFLFRNVKYFPLAVGVCVAIVQYIPEMIQKRIKLSLHLPLSNRRIVFSMLGFGTALVFTILLLHMLAIIVFASVHFSKEFVISIIHTLAPWYMAGLMTYLLLAWICLEPTWKRRIFNTLIMLGTLPLCFLSDFPGAYGHVHLILLIVPIYLLPFAYFSVHRFKAGIQD